MVTEYEDLSDEVKIEEFIKYRDLVKIDHDKRTPEQQAQIEAYIDRQQFNRMGETPDKSFCEKYDTSPISRRPGNQEYSILDFTELVCQIMQYHHIKRKQLAKELGIKKKKLNYWLNVDAGDLTIRQMSDIMFALGKKLQFSAKDDTSTNFKALI